MKFPEGKIREMSCWTLLEPGSDAFESLLFRQSLSRFDKQCDRNRRVPYQKMGEAVHSLQTVALERIYRSSFVAVCFLQGAQRGQSTTYGASLFARAPSDMSCGRRLPTNFLPRDFSIPSPLSTSCRYHKAKFFDRRKALRRLAQIHRKLKGVRLRLRF